MQKNNIQFRRQVLQAKSLVGIFMKSILFALSSVLLATGTAMAADLQAVAQSIPVASWFGYVEGGYVFRANSQTQEFETGNYDEARTGDGGYGAAKLGYRINDAWDMAASYSYLEQSAGRINDDLYGWQFSGGRYWNADVEAGYHLQQDDWSLRPFAGLRYQHYGADFTDNEPPVFTATETSWGIGPRLGMDVSKPLGAQLSFFGSADASVLFGKIKAKRDYGSGLEEFSESRTFATVGLKTGLAWEFAPGVKLGAGYQLEYLYGVGYKNFYDANTVPAGKASQLTHGPFARISFNY
ncbi:outer membrane beta-barrel protein [Mesorhizobium sp. B2-1-8]|uniref:Lpg1974 family pore-forming outer membrane protein n=1 Tax=unclassified Mesorhizobium TaxID=325217 RepID=UPI00112AA5AE|nr:MULTISPECIES: Lpg1974 family pore-forming outer membrane protein [unclassified Mesorhizobium]TPI34595.1 autotransporter outer membrane beta-barrel domain-containing protein [Mesorhizobium sp. B3-2-1]UCI17053.1 outer membrane beta-barrel protein [Mesorhizobium sp. B2-1-8]